MDLEGPLLFQQGQFLGREWNRSFRACSKLNVALFQMILWCDLHPPIIEMHEARFAKKVAIALAQNIFLIVAWDLPEQNVF